MAKQFDVLGIGNAIVDVLTHTNEAFLDRFGMTKGIMALVDEQQAMDIYGAMGPAKEVSGGSVANSMAGLSGFGARAGYIGRVKDDQIGNIFMHDIRSAGVEFICEPATSGPASAVSYILVTEDGQRTMNTYLGACTELGPDDVEEDVISSAETILIEGYLLDPPSANQAVMKAVEIAERRGVKIAISLSDPFCVERHLEQFRGLVRNHATLVFANEDEIKMLAGAEEFEDSVEAVRGMNCVAALTRSEKGAVIVHRDETAICTAAPIERVLDATGAGDLFAAGFLYGLSRGQSLQACGDCGALAAAHIIQRLGARPDANFKF